MSVDMKEFQMSIVVRTGQVKEQAMHFAFSKAE